MPTELRSDHAPRFNAGAIAERPHIAASMMKVICLCSELDYRWAVLLAEMLEAEARAGVAMFNAVDNQAARGRLLKAAAEERLDAQHRTALTKLMDSTREPRKVRDLIAHGQWGAVAGDADGLVLGDGKWASKAVASHLAGKHGVVTILGSVTTPMTMRRYTAADFDKIAREFEILIERQLDLTKAFQEYRQKMRGLVFSHRLAEKVGPSEEDRPL